VGALGWRAAASRPEYLPGNAMRKRAPTYVALLTATTLVALLAGGCGSQKPTRKVVRKVADARPADPIYGRSFYVVSSPATLEAAQLRATGQLADARALTRLADQPTATWLTGQPNVAAVVRALTLRATALHKSTLLVAYDIPGRDCGGYSSGGAPSAAAYRAWIVQLAQGIGNRVATVIVEPDAIAQSLMSQCASAAMGAARLSLLRFAVATLKAQRNVTVYIDAGNPGWIKPASRLAPSLRAAGISIANGFALNVANFYSTKSVIHYGLKLSDALGGKHFVIDTGRNGNGPPSSASSASDGPTWCNPAGRALGQDPTTTTSNPRVDAYLWIKPPGYSDGACQPGDPPAGQWMASYALSLALG
jgi:endoglucanase